MIEIRFNLVDMQRVKHDISHWVAVLNVAREAGMPLVGTIGFRSVEHGTLIITTEEDLDGDISIWRWWENGEQEPIGSKYVLISSGRGNGYTWSKFRKEVDDDDI